MENIMSSLINNYFTPLVSFSISLGSSGTYISNAIKKASDYFLSYFKSKAYVKLENEPEDKWTTT